MSKHSYNPTSMELVKCDNAFRERFRYVNTGQVYGTDNTFHPEGLFSVEIFGMVGSEERNDVFGAIALNTTILTPVIYRLISNLSSLYPRIMEGKEYAVFDSVKKDFVISNDPKAKTGFTFFISKLKDIKFRETESKERAKNIEAIYKSIKDGTCFIDTYPVLPAGMRDYIDSDVGRPEEDEINTFYRAIISRASLVDPVRAKSMPEVFDNNIIGIQKAVYELQRYIFSMMSGKGKLLQDKFAARKVFNTTSNVVSSYVDRTTGLNDKRTFKYNDTRVSLYQYLRSAAPLTTYHVKNKYISQIFPSGVNTVFLTNLKTWKREEVDVRSIQKDMDLWRTSDGLDKIFASLGNLTLRDKPPLFKGVDMDGRKGEYGLGLLYQDDVSFKFFQDIDELPPGYDKDKVKPVSLFEFIYMSVYSMSGKYPALITRYPVLGYGSIYPSMAVISTTIDTKTLRELDGQWNPYEGDDYEATFFPIPSSGYVGTLIIHAAHLGRLGGDYDGDMMHVKMLLSDEAIAETKKVLASKEYYISDKGTLYFSNATDVITAVFKTLS